MLVLSRKVGEELIVGNEIHIMVVAVQGNKVRIGISAPEEVPVDRQEIHEQRQDPLNYWVQRGSPDRPLPLEMN